MPANNNEYWNTLGNGMRQPGHVANPNQFGQSSPIVYPNGTFMNPMGGNFQNGSNFPSFDAIQGQSPNVNVPFTGRFVENPKEIMPNEVPMDGRLGIFPSRDLSTITVKAWNANGTIMNVRYILDPSQVQDDAPDPQKETRDILARLEAIEKTLAANNVQKQSRTNKSKSNANATDDQNTEE